MSADSLLFSGVGLNHELLVDDGLPAVLFCGGERKKAAESQKDRVDATRKRNGFSRTEREEEVGEEKVAEEEESESSSIGVASSSSSDKEDGEEEVQSKEKGGAFGSLETLEESLPIKGGLSNFFSGKSKSFASLSDLSNASTIDLVKPENPFNKRRRLLMAYEFTRASYSSFISTASTASSSLSLFSPDHKVEEEEEEEEEVLVEKCKSPLANHGVFLPL